MKQDHILNFIWWLATPFFIVFFFLTLMLFTGGVNYINVFLYLTLYLVTIPLFVDWIVAIFYPKNEELRPKTSVIVYFIAFVLSFIFIVNNFSDILRFFYLIFALQVIISFVLRIFKQNQYTFLLGVFLAITIMFSILMVNDLLYLILIELIFTGILMQYFIKFKIDTVNKMLLYYFLGLFSTVITTTVAFYLLKF